MNEVESYYDETYDEWTRLEKHKIEFDITKRYLTQYLPAGSLKIFDIGGGPGRYALHLAEQGHRVSLLDLAKRHLEIAKVEAKKRGFELEAYIHGNALDLERYGQDYDAVLLMGPLYHLTEEADRRKVVEEALRLLKPEGILVAAFISNYAPLLDNLKYLAPIESVEGLLHYLKEGGNRGEIGFTLSYFSGPQEARQLMQGFGLTELVFAGVENVLCLREQEINKLPQEEYEKWLEVCWRLSQDPHLWGVSEHYLYIGRK